MTSMELPDLFKQNVVGAFSDGGAWLESLPALLAECQDRWRITLGPPFELSFNYVAPAITVDRQAVVIKLGVPNLGLTSEIQALQLYAGEGSCIFAKIFSRAIRGSEFGCGSAAR